MSCIIVLGVYRSGTSAVAGVLHHLGIPMGKEFDQPHKNNPLGFWEDKEFKFLHNQLEAAARNCNQEVYNEFYKKYLELAQERNKQPIWGIKDPLLCSYLPILLSVLDDHKLIVCRRNMNDIANSVNKVTSQHEFDFSPIIKHYADSMEANLAVYPNPVLELHFEDLIKNKVTEIQRIADFVGMPVTEAAISSISDERK